jgi:hypothetical protein
MAGDFDGNQTARHEMRSSSGMNRRTLRRIVGGILVVAGGLMMWLSTEALLGVALLAAGIVLEIVGITLERR